MNALIVPRGESLVEQALAHLAGEGRDYSSSLVVFPGKRPSHFLRKALAAKVGSAFIPPVILSMDEFVDSVSEELQQGRRLETIDAVALLYGIHRKARRPLGGDGFMSPDSFFSLGLKIYRDIEELTIEGIGARKVREIESLVEGGIPEQTRERFQSLSFFYEEFYRECASLGFSTRSGRYRLAADRIDEAGPVGYRRIIFAGFFALTHAEKVLFRKLLSRDETVFLFQEGPGIEEKLRGLGVSAREKAKGAAEPALYFYSSPDTHGQTLALGKVLMTKTAGGGALDERTVIVLPSSETLFPLVRQGLSAIPEESYNVSLGYPLHRTPVFGFLNNLMELVASMDGERLYVPDYLKFVLHPYTKNMYFEGKSETTRILFHAVEEELLTRRMKTFVTLEEIEGNETFFRNVITMLPEEEKGITAARLQEHLRAIHRSTIGKFLSFEDVSDFAKKCIEVLIYVFNNSTARLHPLFSPFSEAFVTNLELLPRSLMREIAFAERSSYFTFFRKYLMTCHAPFSGTPVKGLQVLGFLETRNLKFDRVFVLDANEEVLPDTGREETLLPFRAREVLGLPTYLDRDRLVSYYFDCLLGGAGEVHLFFVENDKTEKSRFVEKLLWERQKKEKATDMKRYIRPVQYQVTLVNRDPAPVPKSGEMVSFLRGFTYSATALNVYLRCPLRFYYSFVLGLSRRKEITGEIERADLGTFVHAVLKTYFSHKRGRVLKAQEIDPGGMDRLVEDLFEKEYGRDVSGAAYLMKRQIKRHMADFLKEYYAPLVRRSRVTIAGVEVSLGARIGPFALKGRLDSIEERDGKTVIVDFKTGAQANPLKIDIEALDLRRRETWGRAIGSLQLPFYVLLYSEKKRLPVTDLNALFLLLGRSRIDEKLELPLFDPASPGDAYEPAKTVIFTLLQEITDPSVPFSASTDRKRACPSCDFPYFCGTQWIVK